MTTQPTRRSKPAAPCWGFPACASLLAPLALVYCVSAPTNDASTPVLTVQAGFTLVWDSSIEVLAAEQLIMRCVYGANAARLSETECPAGSAASGAPSDRPGGRTGILGTEWTGVDPSGLNCGGADLSSVFSGHQAQFEVTITEASISTTTVRVIGTYRARAASAVAGEWSACASNGEPEREVRAQIVRRVETRQG